MCIQPTSPCKSSCATTLLTGFLLITLSSPGCGLPCADPNLLGNDIPTDYETQVASLLQYYNSGDPNALALEAAGGVCGDDGPLFIVSFTGPFSWRYDYFDRDTGEFLGRFEGLSDIPPWYPCLDRYWPFRVHCPDAVITEVIVGERFAGDGATSLPPR